MNAVIDKSIPMPLCLVRRPLKFGDREQIEAIQQIEERLTAKPGLKRYEVTVEKVIEYTTIVEAESEDDAIDKAVDEDHDSCEDVSTSVRLINQTGEAA